MEKKLSILDFTKDKVKAKIDRSKSLSVTLVEPFASGHHIEYVLYTLSEFKKNNVKVHFVGALEICKFVENQVESVTSIVLDLKGSFIKRERDRIKFFNKVFSIVEKNRSNLVHFLYVDHLLRSLLLSNKYTEIPVVASLHAAYMMPQFNQGFYRKVIAYIERNVLQYLIRRDLHLIVHSETIADIFNRMKPSSATAINYPVAEKYQMNEEGACQLRHRFSIKNSDKLILCFGGTRNDKGADIAVNTLKYLPRNYHLLIAGKEEQISYKLLISLAGENNFRLHTVDAFIDDTDVINMFSAADVVLLPYSVCFAGQSGPLTIAAAIGKCIVATNSIVIAETIEKYQLGCVVDSRDPEDIAKSILSCKSNNNSELFLSDNSVFNFSFTIFSLYQKVLSMNVSK